MYLIDKHNILRNSDLALYTMSRRLRVYDFIIWTER